MPRTAPFGTWKSPITADLIVAETIGLGLIRVDGEAIYWVELRPQEGGRCVVVRRTKDGQISDVTPAPYNARTRVHEYGGGEYLVHQGVVYFSNFSDQRLYRQEVGAEPKPITPEASYRYADGVIDTSRNRLICVREDHTDPKKEAINTIVSIDLNRNDDPGTVLVEGCDFYATPRINPQGTQLAWLSWNHPNMPWDGTELWVSRLNEGGLPTQGEVIAGGREESIFQPEWSPNGTLHFVSDKSNWWNLYRWENGRTESLCPMEVEFGRPLWQFSMSTYDFLSSDEILCSYTTKGKWYLGILDARTRSFEAIDCPYSEIAGPHALKDGFVFEASSSTKPLAILVGKRDKTHFEVLRSSTTIQLDPGFVSEAQSIEFPTADGQTAYGFFYPPKSKEFEGPGSERPPLLVKSHGGPTAAASSRFTLEIQYFTSRGFAVLDVNYGGSTGFGRDYRKRLEKQWGVVDVDDCVWGAKYLVEQGLVDGNRLAIRGGSAGGFTTLCALTFRDNFKAGASHYGVSDLEALTRDTHKFESRYFDFLIGPYPKDRHLYSKRSPINFAKSLSCPVIFFQGLEDKVVPPNQAEMMVEILKQKNIPVEYVPFEGEQHGFRRAENIKVVFNRELAFYGKVFGFESDPS